MTYLAAARGKPFAHGEWDCALFVTGAVAAMTGEDVGVPFRGRYATAAAGRALVKAAGYRDHVDVFARALRKVPPLLARPGDVVVLPGRTLGLCQGRYAYVVTGAGGLGRLPITDAKAAYRVPFPGEDA